MVSGLLVSSIIGGQYKISKSNFRAGGMGGGGQQFVFNMGGGPGFRVHQFGGQRPGRRPRTANDGTEERPQSLIGILTQLLPLLVLFVLPLLSSLFGGSGDSSSSLPGFKYGKVPPYTTQLHTATYRVPYWVNPNELIDLSPRKTRQLDQRVESTYINDLDYKCQIETQTKQRMMQDAQGWFFPDADKMQAARAMERKSCNRLREMGIASGRY